MKGILALEELCTLYATNGDSGCWEKNTKQYGKPCDCDLVENLQTQLKKIYEWGNGVCGNPDHNKFTKLLILRKRNCRVCWEELKGE